jgi:hypothetical protein
MYVIKEKKFDIFIAITIIALVISFINLVHVETCYTEPCKVHARYGDITTIETQDGELFDFEDTEQKFDAGDRITVTFDDNKTPDNIYDDKIIDVKP